MTPEEHIALHNIKVSDESTPAELIGHGLDPRTPDVKDVAMCGAPFVMPPHLGKDREHEIAICRDCLYAGYAAGLVDEVTI